MSLEYRQRWNNSRGSYFHGLRSVEFSPSGKYLAVGGAAGLVLLKTENGQLVTLIQHAKVSAIVAGWFHSETLVCAFRDGVIVNVSITKGQLNISGLVSHRSVEELSLDPTGKFLATCTGTDIVIWKRSAEERWAVFQRIEPSCHTFPGNPESSVEISSIHWQEGGARLLVSYKFHGVRYYYTTLESIFRIIITHPVSKGMGYFRIHRYQYIQYEEYIIVE
ncbi:hypothetical protein PHLCEN_2v4783 [Hermanssonia centrifuga]|uniref:Uncharacterized protein n=1 Tax=Hermanssonia centrifuga TaxID=98765 RepID=A0A2R6PJ65_9APHY|nr:hypothetical protein PHLCEN_2v4783 [Hermanssonia centrifuga]